MDKKVRTKARIAIAIAIASICAPTIEARGQNLVYAPRIEIGQKVESDGSSSTLRVSSEDGKAIVTRIDENGNVVLRWGAMVDFSGGVVFRAAGKRMGYMTVLVDGKPYLMPLYEVGPVEGGPGQDK
jgi:hypothetical protein